MFPMKYYDLNNVLLSHCGGTTFLRGRVDSVTLLIDISTGGAMENH